MLGALESAQDFVSGDSIAEELGMSRAAVWKHVDALKRTGYEIESLRSRGYRLLGRPDLLNEHEIRRHLQGRGTPLEFLCSAETISTNTDALRLGREGAHEATVVIAESQSGGRGRLGRSWVSVPGLNLHMSVLLRPAIAPGAAPQLGLLAGVAVAAVLEGEGLEPRIKWPNDVLLAGRKVCGILTEIEAETDRVAFIVVGIGLNLNSTTRDLPAELRGSATSMRMVTGAKVDRARLAARLLDELMARYEDYVRAGFARTARDWRSRSALGGRTVQVAAPGADTRGTCLGIDSDGALLVKDEGTGETRRIVAGDVTLRETGGGTGPRRGSKER